MVVILLLQEKRGQISFLNTHFHPMVVLKKIADWPPRAILLISYKNEKLSPLILLLVLFVS
jgi:hypothetical protein